MTLIKRAYFRFKALLFGASKRQDLEDEMQSHLDMRIEEHITSGMSPEEARNAALKEFGGVEQIKEECIDSWGVRIANDLLQDIHFGFRQILKHKGFTAVVILTLALCIGANTVIFSVINSIFFKPYPFPDVDRLVLIWNKFPQVGIDKYVNQKVHYLERTRDTTVFEDLALINIESYNIEISGSPERARGMRVTPSFFPTLKIQPFLGRSFTERETDIGNEKVAILSYGLWQRMYGGEETAIGKIIPLNGEGYTIVGIMPDSYQLPSRKVDLWTPIILTPKTLSPGDRIVESDNYEYEMIGRLKSSETLISAQREIDLVNERNMQLYPNSYKLEIKSGFGSTGWVPINWTIANETIFQQKEGKSS